HTYASVVMCLYYFSRTAFSLTWSLPFWLFCFVSFSSYGHRRHLPSFPTRRSSDLLADFPRQHKAAAYRHGNADQKHTRCRSAAPDRKSTRLNSSHVSISYAVFCLKKKTERSCTRIRSMTGSKD